MVINRKINIDIDKPLPPLQHSFHSISILSFPYKIQSKFDSAKKFQKFFFLLGLNRTRMDFEREAKKKEGMKEKFLKWFSKARGWKIYGKTIQTNSPFHPQQQK